MECLLGDGDGDAELARQCPIPHPHDRESLLGAIEAYVIPSAAEVDFADWADAVSGDLDTIGSAITTEDGGLDDTLVGRYGEPARGSVVMVNSISLDPAVRGIGVAAHSMGMLVYANPDTALIACYPHPIVGDPLEMTVDELGRAQRRLARHWQQYGFQPVPGGIGVHVADPDALLEHFRRR